MQLSCHYSLCDYLKHNIAVQIISKFCSLLEFLQHIPYRFTSWWFPDLGKDNLNQCLIVMLRYLNSKVLGQMLFWNGVVAFTGSWLMFRISCFQIISIIPTLPSCALFVPCCVGTTRVTVSCPFSAQQCVNHLPLKSWLVSLEYFMYFTEILTNPWSRISWCLLEVRMVCCMPRAGPFK